MGGMVRMSGIPHHPVEAGKVVVVEDKPKKKSKKSVQDAIARGAALK